ncbi:DUF7344 domain-containing protein [Halalkalicoccus paucihalophilus]|uniref:DUF7344 domain-containing protein n=1 Tax=Halalkalicoccus paucihalophilus TaxID=1008153 RepID=UPI000A06125D|nr:hypothetical protein [Halalkalicoccus paucihalophilus]
MEAAVTERNPVSPITLSLETIFELLSERRRRYTLYALYETENDGIYLDEPASHVAQLEAPDDQSSTEPVEPYLQEQCLPTLADANVINYDPRTNAVHYWQNPSLEEWVEHAAFKENKLDW